MLRNKEYTDPAKLSNHSPENPENGELEQEQAYVSMLYARLDAVRAQTANRLGVTYTGRTAENNQAASERQTMSDMYVGKLAQLTAVERGLCFGRLDLESDERLYIGRIGLSDEEYEPLLIDWRAPAAKPFYRATPVERHGVVLRRHLRTKGRTVVGIDDDVLDFAAVGDSERPHLTGEAALLASLSAGRTGRMSDIVATIQAEQDAIIRSDLKGVVVVEGGPGTGKTVVALHRAAYLLYTYRERLAKRGILVIGPNSTFVRYIDQVLPSLGETEVVLATVGSLFPGVTVTAVETPDTAIVKGDLRMVDVVRNAVKDRQWVPDDHLDVVVDGDTYRLTRGVCARARADARRLRDDFNGGPEVHNRARRVFVQAILDELTRQEVERLGGPELLEPENIEDIRKLFASDPGVYSALDALWPELSPQRLLTELFVSRERLAAAAPELTGAERAALHRPAGSPWTAADVPLLDEAAELIGPVDATLYTAANAGAQRKAQLEDSHLFATQVIEKLREDGELPNMLDEDVEVFANHIVGHYDESGPRGTLAERALADREWTYGHVIVDEAQELSAMVWRVLMRRCPARSMTVVGDLAQTGAPDGATSWAQVLDPFAVGRWHTARLSVNYRTPKQIMAVADEVLAATDPALEPPTSVRETPDQPWAMRVETDSLEVDLPAYVGNELTAIGEGRLAIIVPDPRADELVALIERAVPGSASGSTARLLDAPVAVLTSKQTKGLEFDAVIVVDPAGIVAESERGLSDLYVALTRATRRLGIVYEGDLPDVLKGLQPLRF
ncbi:HelD family protein [Flindersiella endophytica]